MSRSLPSVTVIVPTFDEAANVDACLASLAAQDYAGEVQVLVADGGSRDGTLDRIAVWADRLPGLQVLHNPARVQAHGMNLAAAAAGGEILVRADAHTTYAPDYVRRSVGTLLDTGAAVGGVMRPVGNRAFGRAVAAAMTSPLTIGSGKFHYATARAEVDTVYLGAFRRSGFLTLGGMRRFPSGVAEDADFYYRWRRAGGTVVVEPAIRSVYRPRETPWALFRQYLRYGEGKAEMLYVNHRLPSWRPLAPLALVLALAGAAVVAAATPWQWPLVVLLAAWMVPLAIVAVRAGVLAPLVLAASAIMHVAYGIGMIVGLARGRRARRMVAAAVASARAVGGVVPPPTDDPAEHPDR